MLAGQSNIEVININDFEGISINDYVSLDTFMKWMNECCQADLLDLIGMNVLWNSSKQKINKGKFYVIVVAQRVYNIHIDEECVTVDEKIKAEDTTEERIIWYNTNSHDFGFNSFKHDQNGSTFYTRYYQKNKTSLGSLNLSIDEATREIKQLVSNLEEIENISSIINLDLLKKWVIEELETLSLNRKKPN